ncbi:MAG: hypothetical protein M1541_12655 [Acidobacteria bacterium]|nr:hypothetical protein [Acidobacteriota bacterium]
MATPRFVEGAGRWLLHSGIQEASGGVARYYRSDIGRNNPISTEITGYAVSTMVYLHALTGEQFYLDSAVKAARFLARTAWDPVHLCYPCDYGCANGAGALTYFFDSGIIVRGLMAAWRATGEAEFLEAAARCGESMLRDFSAGEEFHPIVMLADKRPAPRDERWSRSTGCYQLKSALCWHDLAAATGRDEFAGPYCRVLDAAIRSHAGFLPGHPDRNKVMDRLHAYSYFLEGMLPRAGESACAKALREGIDNLSQWLRDIAPQFARSDVYAQLLRIRIFADWAGVLPVDQKAAACEAAHLAAFQCHHPDPRMDGGFWFGRKGAQWLPYVNPVSTGFALQALAMWQQHLAGEPQTYPHMLI